jgi:hypothetical protein
MSAPNVKGLVYAGASTLPIGFLLFIGGVVSIIAKEVALGGVLMGLGIATLVTGCVLMLIMNIRLRAYNRELQAKQQADLGATFRDYPGGRLP